MKVELAHSFPLAHPHPPLWARWVTLAVSTTALGGLCGGASAQAGGGTVAVVSAEVPDAVPVGGTSAAALPARSEVPRLRGFVIEGDNPLSSHDESLALAPFLRVALTLDNLQKAVQALEDALKANGHSLHRVVLAPQEVTDTVKLRVVSFALGEVTVDGAQAFGVDNIRRSLPALKPGVTPNLSELAMQTALANDNPAKNVQVALRASPTLPDRIDATVRVKDSSPLQWRASLSNTGTAATGRDRLTVSGSHSNLWDLDHQFAAAYTTSLAHPGDVSQVGLTYRLPLYAVGGMLDTSYTRSSVVGQFGSFSSTGAGHTLGIQYTHHYAKDGALARQASLGLEDKVFEPVSLNGQLLVGQQTRRSRPLTVGYHLRTESDQAYWQAGATLSMNLPGGIGNGLDAYRSERPAIDTVHWSALRLEAARVQALQNGWLLGVRMQAQLSPHALIAGEQFGLGGAASVRGTGERVLAGDSGVLSSFELTSPKLWSGARGVFFVDGGWLQRRTGTNAALPAQDSLASVGLGLRWGEGPWAMGLDYGRIVQGSRTDRTLNPDLPQRGDHKLHLNISARF